MSSDCSSIFIRKFGRYDDSVAVWMGETITQEITKSLEERLLREEGKRKVRRPSEELLDIGKRCAGLPDLDSRSPDEVIGYDEQGLPR